jgi:hypothetical protein
VKINRSHHREVLDWSGQHIRVCVKLLAIARLLIERQDLRVPESILQFLIVATISAGVPSALPIMGFVQGPARRQFDITPDGGKQFLMLFPY